MRVWWRLRHGYWLGMLLLCVACGSGAATPSAVPTGAPTSAGENLGSSLPPLGGKGVPCPSAAGPLGGPVAFVATGNLWVMQPDGSERTAVTKLDFNVAVTSPQWSPDGQTLAFTFTQPAMDDALSWLPVSQICAIDRATGQGKVLAGPPSARDALVDASWSADGKSLLVTEVINEIDSKLQYLGAKRTLVRLDLATRERTVLATESGQAHAAPNGTAMIYVNREATAQVMLADGKGAQAKALPLPAFADVTWPMWSPDSQTVVMATSGAPAPAGSRLPRLFELLLGVEPVAAHGTPADLWLWDVATQQARALTTQGIDEPRMTWSPDGQTIMYTAGLTGGVYALSVKDGTAKQISPIGDYGGISWTK